MCQQFKLVFANVPFLLMIDLHRLQICPQRMLYTLPDPSELLYKGFIVSVEISLVQGQEQQNEKVARNCPVCWVARDHIKTVPDFLQLLFLNKVSLRSLHVAWHNKLTFHKPLKMFLKWFALIGGANDIPALHCNSVNMISLPDESWSSKLENLQCRWYMLQKQL